MPIRQAVRLFALTLAGATLAGCAQQKVTERSTLQGVSSQASPGQAVLQRRASVAQHRRAAEASGKHASLIARPAAKPEASTDGSVGIASFYRYDTKTASGEPFDPRQLTAAHRTLPFGTRVRVTNASGKSVVVRINDRGPFHGGRVIDLSQAAAAELGLVRAGSGRVTLALLDN